MATSVRVMRRLKPLLLLLLIDMCAYKAAGNNGVTVFAAAVTPLDPPEKPSIVTVPTGVTTVVLNGEVTQQIACDVIPDSMLRVEMTLMDGNNTRVTGPFVVPKVLVFVNTNTSGEPVKQSKTFTIFGHTAGRFYLSYALSGDVQLYKLSAVSSVISVVEESQGWQGIWYELGFNIALFTAGMLFFVWRRMHRLELPIWKGHQAGLFERANYDDLEPSLFNNKYREIMGATVRQRMNIFLSLPTHGSYMCHTCGIPAALNLQFHVDAGHLFSVLTFFSIAVMLPVNYLSGKPTTSVGVSNSFQQTTFSNVPLHSNWYWAHVGYCYLIAGCVLAFIVRQSRLASTLQKRTKRIVGARSILIHHGLPPHFSSKKLRAILHDNYFPTGVDEVTVIDDLTQVHSILHHRRELSDQLDRMRMLDACYEHGTLSWNLLFCPGSVLAPSPTEVLSSYFCCKPCRYAYRHERISQCVCPKDKRKALPALYSSVKSDREIWDPRAKSAIQSLDDELDFFPEEALRVYNNRKCMGAAFIVFESSAKRNEFVRLVRAHSWGGKLLNAVDACSYSRQDRGDDNVDERSTSFAKENTNNELAPYLSQLVLTSAPEPDDIIWMNLKYRPYSFTGALGFLARQCLTTGLLLLFSSPTAVLVYMKLDSSSELYQDLENRHSFLVTLVVSYLPSLLLITVNWFLLAFLYYVTMTEPSISESRRTNIFLIKGFIYLVMSSVLLPSIGITAVYLAVSGVEKSGRTYVETFLYKVSGTFFISYVCQRTFLGAVMDITRSAERSAYQPWVLSRSVTEEEKRFNKKPWPYFYGHDYALILSVFMMILLGTVITPILTPFGALYFYLKFFTTKYNFLYVMPYSPGRGHIAQTAVTIAFVCLILFEFTMAFVFLQVAGRKQFTAMIVLSSCTLAFYVMRISGMSAVVQRRLSGDRAKRRAAAVRKDDKAAAICEQGQGKGRTVLSSPPTSLDQELRLKETYADPYKVALSLFKLLGVNQFHQMTSRRTQLTYAFYRLRRHAKMVAKEDVSLDAAAHSRRPGKGQHDLV